MARNPTGCDTKVTGIQVLMTLVIVMAVVIGEKLTSTGPPTATICPQIGNSCPQKRVVYMKQNAHKQVLRCNVAGNPPPKIEWILEKDKIFPHEKCTPEHGYCMRDDGKELVIYKLDDYIGDVRCKAKNQHGTALSDKVTLAKTKFSPRRHRRPTTVKLKLHESKKIKTAQFQIVPEEEAVISWEYDHSHFGDRIIHPSKDSIYLTDVHSSDDGKIIKCHLTMHDVTKDTACGHFKIVVEGNQEEQSPSCLHPNQHLHFLEQEPVKLYCLCSSVHKGTITWYKDNTRIGEGYVLDLQNMTKDHSATYTCNATNGRGKSSITFNVNIQSAPVVTEAPESISINPSVSLEKPLQFTCKGVGAPAPQAAWFINDKPLYEKCPGEGHFPGTCESDGVLYVTELKSVNIHCNLSNSHGYHWLQTFLNVTEEATSLMPIVNPTTTTESTVTTTVTTMTTTDKLYAKTTKMKPSKTPKPEAPNTKPSTEKPVKITKPTLSPTKGNLLSTLFPNSRTNNPAVTEKYNEVSKDDADDTLVTFELPIKYILIGAGVGVLILIIITIVCTYLCIRAFQKRRQSQADDVRYPPRSVSNLSYISHLQRIRDFDRESDDSGIDERSELKSKLSIPRNENQDNQKNEFDEMIALEDIVEHV